MCTLTNIEAIDLQLTTCCQYAIRPGNETDLTTHTHTHKYVHTTSACEGGKHSKQLIMYQLFGVVGS